MRAAVLYGPRDLCVVDVPEPSLGPHDVLVRPEAVGICSTDVQVEPLVTERGRLDSAIDLFRRLDSRQAPPIRAVIYP